MTRPDPIVTAADEEPRMGDRGRPGSRVILGTRGSDLALAQERMVRQALEAAHPGLAVSREIIRTIGDKRPDLRLSEFGDRGAGVVDKGIFTKELEAALEAGSIHAAVHSLKDVPTELDEGFEIVAVLPRAPAEDVLVSRRPGGLRGLRKQARVATSSVRRRALLGELRPDLRVEEIRGNVPTRLRKLVDDDALDGILLARAGLERLGLFDGSSDELAVDGAVLRVDPLDSGDFVPAAAQGAVGIETWRADAGLRSLLAGINDEATLLCVRSERHFLHLLGAGCQTPVGAHASLRGTLLHLSVAVFADDGGRSRSRSRRAEGSGPADDPEGLAARVFQAVGGR